MASLNTLRTRGGIIVSIVISIALLAFILSDSTIIDFVTGGNSARDPKLGEIAGKNVKYSEYLSERNRLETISKLMTGRTPSSDDYDALGNMAWESFIMRHSYQPGFDRLGVNVSEAEQVDMTTGVYLSPVITGTFVNQSTGMYDPAVLRDFVDNRSTYEDNLIWNYLKEQMNNQRVMSKYMDLVQKGIFVTDLEVDRGVTADNRIADARVVSQPYSSIADSLVTVSGNEIKDYYREHKNMFKQTPSRDIDYVVFDILPSAADYDKAAQRAEELAEAFAKAEDPALYATLNSPDDRTPARFMSRAQIDSEIAAVVLDDQTAVYGPVLKGDTYTIARLAETRMLPDSIGVRHILLPPTDKALADSLMGAIRSGADFGELADEYSIDRNTSFMGGDMGVFTPEAVQAELPDFTEAVLNASRGDLLLVEAPYGLHIVRVTQKTAPVQKYKVATIKYTVKASTATQSSVVNQAQRFYAEANGSYDNFQKAVSESSTSKRTARLRNSDRTVSGLENSGEVVRWAFNHKRGTVSEPIAAGLDHYIVAVVTDVRDDEYATADQSAQSIRSTLVRQKKGEMLAEKMKGSSLDAVASSVGAEVVELEGVRFQDFYLQGVGVEPRLVGAITFTQNLNTVSQPVIGASGVYVYEVTGVENTDNTDKIDERIKLEANSTSYVGERASQAMFESSNIRDERVKFL